MKIILKQDVEKLGKLGDIKEVADGYARNFLFPRNLAVFATLQEIKKIEKLKEFEAKKLEGIRKNAQKIKEILEGKTIIIKTKVGPEGKLFGSISEKEILSKIKKEYKIELNKQNIKIQEPIKKIGECKIEIKPTEDIKFDLKIKIEKENESVSKKEKK